MAGRFGMVVQAAAKLSGRQLKVFVALACYADSDGFCFPSVRTIADDIEANERTVTRSLSELSDLGFVDITRRDGKANTYVIITPDKVGTPDKPDRLTNLSETPDKSDAKPLTKLSETPDKVVLLIDREHTKNKPYEQTNNTTEVFGGVVDFEYFDVLFDQHAAAALRWKGNANRGGLHSEARAVYDDLWKTGVINADNVGDIVAVHKTDCATNSGWSEYIPHLKTWLTKKRWIDAQAISKVIAKPAPKRENTPAIERTKPELTPAGKQYAALLVARATSGQPTDGEAMQSAYLEKYGEKYAVAN